MKRKVIDNVVAFILYLSSAIVLGILIWFIYTILKQGLSALSFNFIFGRPLEMEAGGGIGPELFNTFYILILSLIVTIPIGLGTGIYFAEYAKNGLGTRIIRLGVETLASLPSIVLGLFGMIVFVIGMKMGFSIIGGALTLSIINIPVIVSVTETAFKEVNPTYKEASLALGTTKWQMIYSIMLPCAFPKILNGINLAIGRAIGESAILIFTAGTNVSRSFPDFNILSTGETLSVHLWYVKAIGLIPDADKIAAGSAAVLILIILIINILMKVMSYKMQNKFFGKSKVI
ncbi:MAG: phosphate ABC transporter permease PstA [Caloramator sp.]|nr:phosphate ABC transporter permease PstA [Caloramator sp.]